MKDILKEFDEGLIEDWLDSDYHNGKLKINFSEIQDISQLLTPRLKDLISQAITKTREETIKEVEDSLPLKYHPDGDSEKGYNACLSEIKITLNKLKK